MQLEATARGPASLSNLGPGFDTLGLAIGGIADEVRVRRSTESGIRITSVSGVTKQIPMDARSNCAGVAAQSVMDLSSESFGLDIDIVKGIPLGSGIGGSAASAAAAALATNHLLQEPFKREELVESVLRGEFVASQARHGDNAIPALLGGAISVSSHKADSFKRLPLHAFPSIIVLLPEIQVKTADARALLPEQVSFKEAIDNASDLAQLMSGMVMSDWKLVGKKIMSDRFVEPRRARLIPGFESIRAASLEAGALGCAITGSGPAVFALATCPDLDAIGKQMQMTAAKHGLNSSYFISEIDFDGAVILLDEG